MAHKDERKDYDTRKGTIRFRPDRPLPAALVRKLVKARIAENGSRVLELRVGLAWLIISCDSAISGRRVAAENEARRRKQAM